jgi:hypothetical protein
MKSRSPTAQAGRGLVHFSANRHFLTAKARPENMDLSPSAPRGVAWGFVLLSCLAVAGWAATAAGADGAKAAPARRPVPKITQPTMFDTPEADKVLSAMQIFPKDNPWNQDVSGWPLHPNSQNIIASIGAQKPFRQNSDMGFILVPPDQKRIDVKIVGYPDESDKGPYPVPEGMPIEGWPVNYQGKNVRLDDVERDRLHEDGDRHAIVVDPARGILYEFYQAKKTDAGWQAAQASIFDLRSNRLRPDGWTSTDAAGLPIFPAVVRYDELKRGMVEHALRVTCVRTRRAYVAPATHFASSRTDPNLPRMGERIRLKKDYPIDGFSPNVQAVLKGLKKYGMLVADNGQDWAISVAPDPRIPLMHEEFRRIKGSAFEVVEAPRGKGIRD